MVLALFAAACGVATEDEVTELTGESSDALVSAETPIAPDLNAGSANKLGETSGLAASTQYPGFIWMHRDGYAADRPSREFVYAMKIVDRKLVPFTGSSGTYPTREFSFASSVNITNNNWEDMAVGLDVRDNAGWSIYVGDIGNNSGGRNNYQIYQFKEPNPAGSSTVVPALEATWKFAYPPSAKTSTGEFPNCETMFVLDRNIYIVTKESSPRIYRLPTGFHTDPSKTYTLVQVVNGSTQRLVGGPSNPSYGGFSSDRRRFMIGSHQRFFVYDLSAATSALTGDALVKASLLAAGNGPDHAHDIANTKLNTEGGTFELGTQNVVFATESKMVFHWPAANIDAP
jgi:hypothetical protein